MQLTTGTISRGEVGHAEASTLVVDITGREVRAGDRVIPVEAQPYDLQFFPHPPKQEFEYGKAKVIAVADMLSTGGPRDVVALSVGARDGVDNGTVFSSWRVGSECHRSRGRRHRPQLRHRRRRQQGDSCRTSSPATWWCSAPSTRSATRW